ncbi:hypothetical protein [Alicyclobacillus acidocaldarius]|uniref:Uncharacterized protein n=1 Tax=Alicyclobacillus acidocaldarius subsp. acidocaldarius (strain ATCC 27009 / DSM 446 / BCRC 14685 / JCM 5260 / KCTC 1825 / NBRC 15652 / NCIMB 11725 / NRRL B-14509 / 104-IA) TaxID=521098 RepID=C8WSQ2_ALIAD|nr:hypothetical protein [Alicyclobacillus acidocaldarius]ACV57558.1 hypothetical protein Aaci_0500 [Alicyclobacillus acidocaldarius subsp. acidocaldarius DSM 446]
MTESKVMEGRICDPDVMLILTSPERTVELSDFVAQRNWVRGYGQEDSFPTPESAIECLRNEDVIGWRVFWLGLLLRCLLHHSSEIRDFVHERFPQDWVSVVEKADISGWYPAIHRNFEEASDLLDTIDEHLTAIDQWVFIAYDGLEVFDVAGSYMPIRALIGFWFDRLRRWQRLRAKIFLRSDLFSIGRLNFPDASKLFGHLVRLDEC